MLLPDITNIINIHNKIMKNEDSIILNKGLLESAIGSAYQTWAGEELFPTPLEKICRIAWGLIHNHAFEDGNKRIGIATLIIYLGENNFNIPSHKQLIDLAWGIADGSINYEELLSICKKLNKSYNKNLNESYLKPQTPYMLRNDGVLLECGRIHPYIKYNGWGENKDEIESLFNDNLNYLKWFYKNTNKEVTRNNIELFISMIVNSYNKYYNINGFIIGNLIDSFNIDYDAECDQESIEDLFEQINNDTNQEFCRLRTSHMKAPVGHKGKVYFRISSNEFNWFDLIWKLVYDNRNFITNVSICTDTQSKGGRVYFYKHNGQEINEIPINEFLNLSGNPIIESDNEYLNGLRKGKLLEEITGPIPSKHLNYLFKSLSLNESYLFEATWRNQNNLIRHYDKQVLKEGEKFDPDNPKFASNMTLEDYKNEAEKLSEARAEKSVYQTYTYKSEGSDEERERRTLNFKSDVVGWVLEPQPGREGRMPRKIKVSKYINPKFFPPEAKGTGYYRAAVFYVDEPSEDNIISYFIIKDSKFKNLFNHQWLSELPENQEI